MKLHNDDLFTSDVRVVKSRAMRWVGHVARMGEMRNENFWCGNLKIRDHVGNIDVDGWVILIWILKN
jgi:hypothetical protein